MSAKLTDIQKLGLAFGALYSEVYGLKHDSLTGIERPDDEFRQYIREIFESCWGIQSREDLLASLDWRFRYGDRSEYEEEDSPEDAEADDILAWDFCLLIHCARFGFVAGFLSEDEAWDWVTKSAKKIEHKFRSWESFAGSYRRGSSYWNAMNVLKDEHDAFDDAIEHLLDPDNTTSPWNEIHLTGEKLKKGKISEHKNFTPLQWMAILDANPAARGHTHGKRVKH
jgi:hypothetical protein